MPAGSVVALETTDFTPATVKCFAVAGRAGGRTIGEDFGTVFGAVGPTGQMATGAFVAFIAAGGFAVAA